MWVYVCRTSPGVRFWSTCENFDLLARTDRGFECRLPTDRASNMKSLSDFPAFVPGCPVLWLRTWEKCYLPLMDNCFNCIRIPWEKILWRVVHCPGQLYVDNLRVRLLALQLLSSVLPACDKDPDSNADFKREVWPLFFLLTRKLYFREKDTLCCG